MKIHTLLFLILTLSFNSAFAATLKGQVSFSGDVPEPVRLEMEMDPRCQEAYNGQIYNPDVLVHKNQGLKNVFIYIKEGLGDEKFDLPQTSVVLDQKGCLYVPRVIGLQAGQILEIRSSDPTLHNVHARPDQNKRFNLGFPVQGMKMEKRFNHEEVMIEFKCDVHPWMRAYVGVLKHPYFSVTDENGDFQISNLPRGSYTVEIWHEILGRKAEKIYIVNDEDVELNFSYEGN